MTLLATSSFGSGAVPTKSTSAPFHGTSFPSTSWAVTGCKGQASTPQLWRFNLTTGIGTEFEQGRATNKCPPILTSGGMHAFSQATTYGGFAAAVDLGRPAPGTTQVVAALGGQVNISTVVSDGGAWACGKGLDTYLSNDTYEEWNYRNGPNGPYYANSYTHYSQRTDGVWYNFTSGNGVPPSPFPLNNTTYRSHLYYFGKAGFCEVAVTSFYNAYALLYDQTSRNVTNSTGSSWPTGFGFGGYVEAVLSNGTDFEYDNKTTWDGPAATWKNTSGWISNNQSGFFASNYTWPQPSSSFWYNNSRNLPRYASPANTYANDSVVKFGGDKVWFNQSLTSTHRYYLLVYFDLNQIAWTYYFGHTGNNWVGAYAGYTGNSVTSGNGIRLVTVQER